MQAGSTRLGLTARQMVQLARKNRCNAAAYRRNAGELSGLGLPVIAHSRFIHFVVVEAVTSTHVLINDPACGPRRIQRADFEADYTGIALKLTPLASHSRPAPALASDAELLRRLFGPVLSRAAALVAAGMLSQAGIVLAALAVAQGGLSWLGFFALSGLLWGLGRVWHRQTRESLLEQVFTMVRGDVETGLRRLPLDWFARRGSEPVASLLALPLQVQRGTRVLVRVLDLPGLILPAAAAITLAGYPGVVVTAAALAALALAVLVPARRGDVLTQRSGDLTDLAERTPYVPKANVLSHIEGWLFGGRSDELVLRLAGAHAADLASACEAGAATARLQTLIDLARFAGVAALGAAALSDMSTGETLALGLLAVSLLAPPDRLLPVAAAVQGLIGAAARHQDLMASVVRHAREPLHHPATDAPTSRPSTPVLRIQTSKTAILAAPGSVIAVKDPGDGSSATVMRALAGLEAIPGLHASLGSLPMAEAATRFPGWIGFQDVPVPLGPGTVSDMLRLGAPGLPADALVRALEQVELYSEISRRGGLDMWLDPDRPALSGGQQRRLLLARDLLRQPAVLVLDGLFDALEADLERRLRDRIAACGITLVLRGERATVCGRVDHWLTLDGLCDD